MSLMTAILVWFCRGGLACGFVGIVRRPRPIARGRATFPFDGRGRGGLACGFLARFSNACAVARWRLALGGLGWRRRRARRLRRLRIRARRLIAARPLAAAHPFTVRLGIERLAQLAGRIDGLFDGLADVGAPGLLDLALDLIELRLARHVLERALELARHRPALADPLTHGPRHARQILRPDDDQ